MTDINAVIARFHDGIYNRPEISPDSFYKEAKKDNEIVGYSFYGFSCPDYSHDPRLYMALFEEMECAAILKNIDKYSVTVYDPKTITVNILFRSPVESDAIGTAICLAYMQLNGLECEG